MENVITTSLDWQKVYANLQFSIRNFTYRHRADIILMLRYVSHLVDQLSKEEINCRRLQKQTRQHIELVEKINTRIGEIEQFITFAALLG